MLYVDLHLIHEVTSPQAFTVLRERGLAVRRPGPTWRRWTTPRPPLRAGQARDGDHRPRGRRPAPSRSRRTAASSGGAPRAGQRAPGHRARDRSGAGLTQPGSTIVCGDSHTSTHGAFGALAFGIGTSEVAHVLATQCLLQRRPRTLEVSVKGRLGPGVTAKDIILAIIARLGRRRRHRPRHRVHRDGHPRAGHGGADDRLQHVHRGRRARRHVAPDETTFEYLHGRPRAPKGRAWEAAVARWRMLRQRPRRAVSTGASKSTRTARADDHLRDQSGDGHPGPGRVPDPARGNPPPGGRWSGARATWGSRPGQPLRGTSHRRGLHRQLHQRAALRPARRGRPRCSTGGRSRRGCAPWWCPARSEVKRAAEAEGLRPRLPRRRAPSGASRAARCASR